MRVFIFLVLLSISNLLSAQLPQVVSDIGDVFRWQSDLLKNHIVYTTYNEKAYGYENLFSSQGNSVGNVKLIDSVLHLIPVASNEQCFFVRKSDELWKTDGTLSNTKMIFKLPKNFTFWNYRFISSGDYLYFLTKDSIYGEEFWVTDGSGNANSTKMLGPYFLETDQLGTAVAYNGGVLLWVQKNNPLISNDSNDLYFFNKDSQKPVNLTDGFPRWGSGYPHASLSIPIAFKTKAYFAFDHRTYGMELFETDGTAKGTKVIDINAGLGNSFPNDAFIEYGKLFVCAYTKPSIYRNMVTIDESGIENILPFQTQTLITLESGKDYALTNDGIFLKGLSDTTDNRGWELWKTDGTKAGTSFVIDLKPGTQSSYPRYFRYAANTLVFEANKKVYVSNGTDNGTMLMPIEDSLLSAKSFTGYDDKIFFVGKLAQNDYHLYKYDKNSKARKIAPLGAENVINPLGEGNGSVDYGHRDLFTWKGEIFFTANYGQGKKLYKIGPNTSTAINNLVQEESQVLVYPNPSSSILNIQLNDMGESEINYAIFKLDGQLLQEYHQVKLENNSTTIALDNLESGMYFIMINSPYSKYYRRFIKY
jgi:ELWxxDGT repeat protein